MQIYVCARQFSLSCPTHHTRVTVCAPRAGRLIPPSLPSLRSWIFRVSTRRKRRTVKLKSRGCVRSESAARTPYRTAPSLTRPSRSFGPTVVDFVSLHDPPHAPGRPDALGACASSPPTRAPSPRRLTPFFISHLTDARTRTRDIFKNYGALLDLSVSVRRLLLTISPICSLAARARRMRPTTGRARRTTTSCARPPRLRARTPSLTRPSS